MKSIKKILIRNNKVYYWRSGDLHTDSGIVKESDLNTSSSVVKSHCDKEFFMLPASYLDKIKKIKRGPQTLLPKDLAIISFYSSIDKNSKVLDAGSGCGLLAISLARIAKEVVSYDINDDHLKISNFNKEFLDVKNVTFKKKNIYEGIDEDNLDLITLDLPEPWHVLPHAEKSLKQGGYLITYLPSITQVQEFIRETKKHSFIIDKTIEVLEREWFVEGKKVRPKSDMQGHTAFITIIRKK